MAHSCDEARRVYDTLVADFNQNCLLGGVPTLTGRGVNFVFPLPIPGLLRRTDSDYNRFCPLCSLFTVDGDNSMCDSCVKWLQTRHVLRQCMRKKVHGVARDSLAISSTSPWYHEASHQLKANTPLWWLVFGFLKEHYHKLHSNPPLPREKILILTHKANSSFNTTYVNENPRLKNIIPDHTPIIPTIVSHKKTQQIEKRATENVFYSQEFTETRTDHNKPKSTVIKQYDTRVRYTVYNYTPYTHKIYTTTTTTMTITPYRITIEAIDARHMSLHYIVEIEKSTKTTKL